MLEAEKHLLLFLLFRAIPLSENSILDSSWVNINQNILKSYAKFVKIFFGLHTIQCGNLSLLFVPRLYFFE